MQVTRHLLAACGKRVRGPVPDREVCERASFQAADLVAQATPDADTSGLTARYASAKAEDFDGNPKAITEMDALVAYLQMLGTLVDFSTYDAKTNYR